jgi:hypothetical protein
MSNFSETPSLYKRDMHEYVDGIGWVRWRTTGDVPPEAAKFWIYGFEGVTYIGGGYGDLQINDCMPKLLTSVYTLSLGQEEDRVQACITLLKHVDECDKIVICFVWGLRFVVSRLCALEDAIRSHVSWLAAVQDAWCVSIL